MGQGVLFLEDLEDDFPIRARGRCIQDGSERLGRATLFADHATEIFLIDAERENPRRILAGTLGHFDSIRPRNEVLCKEL